MTPPETLPAPPPLAATVFTDPWSADHVQELLGIGRGRSYTLLRNVRTVRDSDGRLWAERTDIVNALTSGGGR